jgi:hypothetical protein
MRHGPLTAFSVPISARNSLAAEQGRSELELGEAT